MRTKPTTTGPDFTDLAQTINYLETNYAHHVLVVMEPLKNRTDAWNVRIIATYSPRTPQQHIMAATKRPEGIIWDCQWSGENNLSLSNTLFRGMFELEIALSELIEQLQLPV